MKQKDYIFIAGVSLVIFLIIYTFLVLIGFAPEQFKIVREDPDLIVVSEDYNRVVLNPEDDAKTYIALDASRSSIPSAISIPKIGVSASIQIPSSIDVSVLDTALTKGAVYYPGSGTLDKGNMFLFGHSTNWKVVNNQAYKTFNGLEKLKAGDEVMLTSGRDTFVYTVTTVKRASEDDALVNFNSNGRMLTISTCDTFGREQDRWVVEAVFSKKV